MTAHVVLGMHRSGTSLLTSLLELAGCDLGPANERGAFDEANPKGFHENLPVVELNDAALSAAGASWFDVLPVVSGGLNLVDQEEFNWRASQALSWTSPTSSWAVKDPRMVPLFGLWRSFLDEPSVVLPIRDPSEVAMSLFVRDGMPLETGAALWEFSVVHALEQSRGLTRCMVLHERLLEDPMREIHRILADLNDPQLAMPSDEQVVRVVDTDLHRNRRDEIDDSAFLTEAQRALYALLLSADDVDALPVLGVSPSAMSRLQEYGPSRKPVPLLVTRPDASSRRTAVVVQGCRLPQFEPSLRAIRETWAAATHPDVDVFFAYGNGCDDHELTPLELASGELLPQVPDGEVMVDGDLLLVGCSDLVDHQNDSLLRKRLLSLQHLIDTDSHDAFLLLCASSYIDLDVLAEHVSTLDLDMRFQGPTFVAESGRAIVSGSAMLLSRDMAQRLVSDGPAMLSASNYRYADDVSISDWVATHISDTEPAMIAERLLAGRQGTTDNTFVQPRVFMLNYVEQEPHDHVKVDGAYHYHFATDKPSTMRRFHEYAFAGGRKEPLGERTIFIQIASYRDRELPRTISSALANADAPDRLRFGICWQYDENTFDDLEPWMSDDRFGIDEVYYRKSDGCTWARSRANAMFSGEDYYLQIDAHMRFAQGWDTQIIDMLEGIPAANPVLTVYPPGYQTDGDGSDELSDSEQHVLALDKINTHLQTRQCTRIAADQHTPGKSPFVAAGFLFAHGSFCEDVPYDPHGYFSGEEIALAARAYTSGYDFFYPSALLVWHRYHHDEPLHWTDRVDAMNVAEDRSRARLKTLLVGDATKLGQYGLGRVRSLQSFEEYCGINFAAAARGELLSGPTTLEMTVDLDVSAIDFDDEYDVWVFALLSSDDNELLRADITDPEVLTGARTSVDMTGSFTVIPTKYLVWPKSKTRGFTERQVQQTGIEIHTQIVTDTETPVVAAQ